MSLIYPQNVVKRGFLNFENINLPLKFAEYMLMYNLTDAIESDPGHSTIISLEKYTCCATCSTIFQAKANRIGCAKLVCCVNDFSLPSSAFIRGGDNHDDHPDAQNKG